MNLDKFDKLDNLFVFSVLIGVFAFACLMGLVFISEKFPGIESKKIYNSVQSVVTLIILICGVVFIFTVLVMILNQPTPYEICMEDAKNMIDQKAIAWMEEYCVLNS